MRLAEEKDRELRRAEAAERARFQAEQEAMDQRAAEGRLLDGGDAELEVRRGWEAALGELGDATRGQTMVQSQWSPTRLRDVKAVMQGALEEDEKRLARYEAEFREAEKREMQRAAVDERSRRAEASGGYPDASDTPSSPQEANENARRDGEARAAEGRSHKASLYSPMQPYGTAIARQTPPNDTPASPVQEASMASGGDPHATPSFEEVDTNGDGVIDRAEYERAVVPPGVHTQSLPWPQMPALEAPQPIRVTVHIAKASLLEAPGIPGQQSWGLVAKAGYSEGNSGTLWCSESAVTPITAHPVFRHRTLFVVTPRALGAGYHEGCLHLSVSHAPSPLYSTQFLTVGAAHVLLSSLSKGTTMLTPPLVDVRHGITSELGRLVIAVTVQTGAPFDTPRPPLRRQGPTPSTQTGGATAARCTATPGSTASAPRSHRAN